MAAMAAMAAMAVLPTNESQTISVIIPTLNEQSALGATLDVVGKLPGRFEIIVVDGGSSDQTVAIAERRGCRVLSAERGRGNQLRVGAVAARGEVLWFLHADTHPPQNSAELIIVALADPRIAGGHFRVGFDGPGRASGFSAWIYAGVQCFGLCYGDSAFFACRDCYERAGGFLPLPLFEDLDLRRRLCREGRFVRVPGRVITSSRRFEGRSAPLTFVRWTALQVLYWMGIPPHRLASFYAAVRSAP